MKKCSRCRCEKPESQFPATGTGRVSCRCFDCQRKKGPRPVQPGTGRLCPSCGEERRHASFFKAASFGSSRKVEAPVCSICRAKEYRPPAGSLIASRCNANAGRSAHRITRLEVEARMQMTGWRCWYCGDKCSGVDHMIPIGYGGKNLPGNIVPCCPDCNRRKKDKRMSGGELRHFRAQMTLRRSTVGGQQGQKENF